MVKVAHNGLQLNIFQHFYFVVSVVPLFLSCRYNNGIKQMFSNC